MVGNIPQPEGVGDCREGFVGKRKMNGVSLEEGDSSSFRDVRYFFLAEAEHLFRQVEAYDGGAPFEAGDFDGEVGCSAAEVEGHAAVGDFRHRRGPAAP